ncbi:MAG: signal peptidase II [Acidimicrobiia bacterium]|nr:signal peptidase II [Acidimicrobiia bacterium]
MIKRLAPGLLAAGLIVLADQLTKRWAQSALPGDPRIVWDGFLVFEYAENPGSAFGLFRDGGQVIGVLAIGISAFVIWMMTTTERRTDLVALGLVLGGALGNVIDRLTRGDGFMDGRVVDFVGLWVIPNFNVADAAINVGVVVLLLMALFVERRA